MNDTAEETLRLALNLARNCGYGVSPCGDDKWTSLSGRRRGCTPPLTAGETEQRFLRGELRTPVRVFVERDGQWLRVKQTDVVETSA
jgi:hypothetical protein